ncbi:hypothetical protein THAOC_01106 [Thalassiosira oceanica]|uniref:Uncharacterized protein n=1 Tax=Thalassiosira oceanica TaxID=159749 RepID=K0TNF4_THAOC|nr:hypothetical protein THAOC_01106 [Thalassiosira oceanica]|eukprot:EJK77086.1 hypothetical protein THAOC_01106 [Thalassiosira oceanica]
MLLPTSIRLLRRSIRAGGAFFGLKFWSSWSKLVRAVVAPPAPASAETGRIRDHPMDSSSLHARTADASPPASPAASTVTAGPALGRSVARHHRLASSPTPRVGPTSPPVVGVATGTFCTQAMESPTKKRRCDGIDFPKTESGFSSTQSENVFVSCCNEVMTTIAQYALPPEVYRLCLTSKRFFDRKSDKLLSSRLLHASLTTSLERVLRTGLAGLSSDQLKSFSEMAASLPPGSVVISGSSLVQAALGDKWDHTDVDIFCTAAAAPAVRSWLVRDARKMVLNAGKVYCPLAVNKESGSFVTAIHHVERYGDVPEKGADVSGSGGRRPVPFDYDEACERGRSVNENLTSRRNIGTLETFGEDFQSAPYRIETADNVPLPFCLTQKCDEWDKVVDLVVCMAEHSSVKAALEDFDINICKCAWDGRSFSIADPHNTFSRRSTVGPEKRKSFLSSYQQHFNSGVHDQIGDVAVQRDGIELPLTYYPHDFLNLIGNTFAAVQSDGTELPLPLLPDHSVAEKHLRRSEMHNCALRTFGRIEKYCKRGIVFDDNFTAIAKEFQDQHVSLVRHFV